MQQLEELVGFGSTRQSDLHPTAAPDASNGPFKLAGQLGLRSTGQSAIGQPALLVMAMGRLKP